MTTGQAESRYNISNISNAVMCVVTTSEANNFATGDFVRLMDLNGNMPVPRGATQENSKKYLIEIVDTTNFKLLDPVTHEYIDSTDYDPYVSGGNANKVAQLFKYN